MERFLAYFGHLNIDTILNVARKAERGSERLLSMRTSLGGTAGNFAMAAKNLGYPFRIYSRVSSLTHARYLSFLKDNGIDTGGIEIDDSVEGPLCYIIDSGQEQTAYMYQGPMESWDSPAIEKDIGEYKMVHFSTGPPSFYQRIARSLNPSQITFDPSQELFYMYDDAQISAFLGKSNIAIMNEDEYERILQVTGKSRDRRNPSFIVTKGSRGAEITSGKKHISCPAFPLQDISSTVGAGDVFRAGFYLGMYLESDLELAVKTGNAAAYLFLKGKGFDGLSKEAVLQLIDL